MSRFFVGQRVRVVSAATLGSAHRVGTEDVVSARYGFLTFSNGDEGVAYSLLGDSDYDRSCMPGWAAWMGDQLEPILPEGHKGCDEDFKRDLDKLLSKEECHASQHDA